MSKAIDSIWFSGPRGCFGLVVGEKSNGERILYAGIVSGIDEQNDERVILEIGSKVSIPLIEQLIAKVKEGKK